MVDETAGVGDGDGDQLAVDQRATADGERRVVELGPVDGVVDAEDLLGGDLADAQVALSSTQAQLDELRATSASSPDVQARIAELEALAADQMQQVTDLNAANEALQGDLHAAAEVRHQDFHAHARHGPAHLRDAFGDCDRALQNQPYLAGELSIADLMLVRGALEKAAAEGA